MWFMSLPWFRMYSEFSGDPVIQSLAFEDQRHYIIILCLKCNGTLDRKIQLPRREQIIARALGLDSPTAEEVKRRLMEVNLIDKKWNPKAWDKRQYVSDNSTERTRKYRKNKKVGNVPETSRNGHGDAPDTEQNRTEQKQKNKGRFTPPTVDEVKAYCAERKNKVDPNKFINFYESKGWMIGKNKMKDWKACVRTWETKDGEAKKARPSALDGLI